MPPKPVAVRQPEEFWIMVMQEYIEGEDSLQDIANKYEGKAAHSLFLRKAAEGKWTEARKLYRQLKQDQAEVLSIESAFDEITLERQTAARLRYSKLADMVTMHLLHTMKRYSGHLSPKDCLQIAEAVRKCQEVEFASLGIPSEALELRSKDDTGSIDWMTWLVKQREEKGLPERKFGVDVRDIQDAVTEKIEEQQEES